VGLWPALFLIHRPFIVAAADWRQPRIVRVIFMSRILKIAAAFGIAGAAAIGLAVSAQAAPLPTSVAKLGNELGKASAAPIIKVQHRRWRGGAARAWRGGGVRRAWRGGGWRGYRYPYRYGYGYGWGWGWPYYYGAGLVVGSAVAAPYYYAPPVYAAPAAPAPATVSGATRQCWVSTDSSRGFGYWQPC
jgi:hypothetical protein